MYIWIASDSTRGRYLDLPDSDLDLTPVAIAYKYGHAETGEIIRIWYSGDSSEQDLDIDDLAALWRGEIRAPLPAAAVHWDSQYREYRSSRHPF